MIGGLKACAKRHWPAMRLRTILTAVLLLAAVMPGLSAIFLRVYENTLVRQTEAELVAQGMALAAMAQVRWPGSLPDAAPADRSAPGYYRPEYTTIDLRASRILDERPDPANSGGPPDADALLAAKDLEAVIAGTTRGTLASILLLDSQGRIVRGSGLGGDLSAQPEVRSALQGFPRTVLRRNADYAPRYRAEWLSRAADIRLHHARPIRVNGKVAGVLLLSRSPRALFRGLYEDGGKILLGIAGVFGILIFLGALVSRTITRPVEALSSASRGVASGLTAAPETPATAAAEIRVLYEDFRIMAEAIKRRSRYLQDFAAAVSHEFKTPLAGIGGAVELLQDHGETMSKKEREGFLANIAQDNARLTQLVSRLLDLARADMAQPDAAAVLNLQAAVEALAERFDGRLAVVCRLPDSIPLVAAPDATVQSVLNALFENSLQAGATRVVVEGAETPQGVVLSVQDDGPGVREADRERLFEPFFTSRRARGGTGLGLSIARSLLAASHGTLRLADSDKGARFELILPPAPLPR